jgi:uncharacterized protein (TIGR03437 family)
MVYLTGQGPVSGPALTDGVPRPAPPPFFTATLPNSATIGGKEATIAFLGLSPGFGASRYPSAEVESRR